MILQDPHPALRTVCAEVLDFGAPLKAVCAKLLEAAAGCTGSRIRVAGLAANQIGECVRVILVEDGGRTFMANPVIVRATGTQQVSDGCMSVNNGLTRRTTTRALNVIVRYQDRDGAHHRRHAAGMRAAVIQHEIDHLDGKLFTDMLEVAP